MDELTQQNQINAKRYQPGMGFNEMLKMQQEVGRMPTPFERLELRAHRGGAKEAMNAQKFQKMYGLSVLMEVIGGTNDEGT